MTCDVEEDNPPKVDSGKKKNESDVKKTEGKPATKRLSPPGKNNKQQSIMSFFTRK